MTDNRPESKYPEFIVGVGFFSWDCDHLVKLHKAIQEWQEKANDDLTISRKRLDAQYADDEGQEFLADWHSQEDARVRETVRIMYAGLAVAIASHVESCFEFFCERCGITLAARADWGAKRNQLEQTIGTAGCLSSVSGSSDVKKVRLLGNCFKHNDGKANAVFVDEYGGVLSEQIDYESQLWDEIINNVGDYLHEVFKMARHHWA